MPIVKRHNDSHEWDGGHIGDAEFRPSPQEGENIQSGEVAEILRTEVEEDGYLASYDAVQLGGHLDETGNSSKGKIYVDLRDNDDNQLDGRTEVRFVARPKNGNTRKELVEWKPLRDLAKEDTRQRHPLPPVTDEEGRPLVVKSGRIIAMEVRNASVDVEVSKENSDFTLPAQFGY